MHTSGPETDSGATKATKLTGAKGQCSVSSYFGSLMDRVTWAAAGSASRCSGPLICNLESTI